MKTCIIPKLENVGPMKIHHFEVGKCGTNGKLHHSEKSENVGPMKITSFRSLSPLTFTERANTKRNKIKIKSIDMEFDSFDIFQMGGWVGGWAHKYTLRL